MTKSTELELFGGLTEEYIQGVGNKGSSTEGVNIRCHQDKRN
jgi:hypothetical protein